MKKVHLNELEIQEFAIQKDNCSSDVVLHIKNCRLCSSKVENYRLIFEHIGEQEKPVFEFNLTELITKQLSAKKVKFRINNRIGIIFIGILLSLICIYAFKECLSGTLINVSFISKSLIALSFSCVLAFQCFELWRKYLIKMKELNFPY